LAPKLVQNPQQNTSLRLMNIALSTSRRQSVLPFVHLLILLLTLPGMRLCAEVTRFEITKREPFADGKEFGNSGPYERIIGKVFYELDPDRVQNGNVIDLKMASRNERGRVELSSDVFILAPVDLSKGNRALLYDVNNRGNKLALGFFNNGGGGNDPQSMSHAGDGFLMRQGFTVVWSGWDGELLPGNNRLRLCPPVALGRGGDDPITGMVRCEIVPSSSTQRTVINWANHGAYRPTANGLKNVTLTHRVLPGHPRVPVPRDQWKLHVTDVQSECANQLPVVELEFPDGLQKGHIYELIYEARDPLVMGTCFTSVRDLISSIKHGIGDGNPLLNDGMPIIERAHGFGVSQSGRFLREFLYWDFNADENGRIVFDGVIPHVSGSGLGSFNHRFAQPTRHAVQHDHHDYPPDRFPFAYELQTDPLSGQTDGILKRSKQSKTAPLILHTQSTSEYWNRSGSLVHTDPLGRRDGKIPENVRIYFFGGTQHGPSGFPPSRGDGQTLSNPGDYKPFLRALLLSLDRWSAGGEEAPPSVYPKIGDGDLVSWTQNATGFPDIPGVRYPGVIQQPSFLDFGPRWHSERIIDNQPPIARGDYRVMVPRCGADGNELACLSPPEVAVPVATFTGWRLRSEAAGAPNELVSLAGSYIPFPTTKSEREKNGDPRRSLEERYATLERYLAQLETKCLELQKAGYLLPEDTKRTLRVQRERVAPLFDKVKLASSERILKTTYTYKNAGDLKIAADVYRPDDEKVRPVLVWIHGGALIMGHREGIDRRVRKMAAENGYVLVSLDYRLAPETPLPEIISDIEDAFSWIQEKGPGLFHADTSRVAVAGGSAGGYLTLTAGYRAKLRPKALLSFWGYGDLIGDWYSKPSPHKRHNPRTITREEALKEIPGPPVSDARLRKGNGGLFYLHCRQTGTWPKAVSSWDPASEAERFFPYMPVKNVTEDYPPTVMIHGTEDTDVPYEQSVMMEKQFEKHGVEHKLISIEHGEHGLGGGDQKAIDDAYREAFQFLKTRLRK
jgi:acetyl esterase/lipase